MQSKVEWSKGEPMRVPSEFNACRNTKFIKLRSARALNGNGQLDMTVTLHSNMLQTGGNNYDSLIACCNEGRMDDVIFPQHGTLQFVTFWFKHFGTDTLPDPESWSFLIEIEFLWSDK